MIDVEEAVIARVYDAVHTEAGDNFKIYSDRTIKPATLPAGFLEEIENSLNTRTSDSGAKENHVYVTYRWTVTSKKKNGKKSECKRLFALGDAALTDLGFARISKQPIDMNSATMYRITGRYSATVDKNLRIIGGQDLG